MTQWQTFNTNKLISWLLPTFLRRSSHLAWLWALLYPIFWLQEHILYKMQHDSRVIYLEKILNEYFEITGYNPQKHQETKVIFIEDLPAEQQGYLYLNAEHKPKYLGKMYLKNNQNKHDFILKIPSTIMANEPEIRVLIAPYKLAGKRYKIERI